MPTLLIVHHTPSPALQAMFEAAVSGARTDETRESGTCLPRLSADAALRGLLRRLVLFLMPE